jgi:hypothetical protein
MPNEPECLFAVKKQSSSGLVRSGVVVDRGVISRYPIASVYPYPSSGCQPGATPLERQAAAIRAVFAVHLFKLLLRYLPSHGRVPENVNFCARKPAATLSPDAGSFTNGPAASAT